MRSINQSKLIIIIIHYTTNDIDNKRLKKIYKLFYSLLRKYEVEKNYPIDSY